MTEPPFYVGYRPKAPPLLARVMKYSAAALLTIAVLLAAVLASSQQPFANSSFDYRHSRAFTGQLLERPVPMLVRETESWVLVGRGKHGAAGAVAGLHGHTVTLEGSLIQYGRDQMIELSPAALRSETAVQDVPARIPIGPVTLTGEIVDSKCYFGVMNPGSGKVHRDCAVRCISGGIPPALLVRDANGQVTTVLLAPNPAADILPFVAEPVSVTGQLVRTAGRLVLETETGSIVRVAGE